jgi:hypothetical protein
VSIKLKTFQHQKIWRIIPSRFPPIALFERVADPRDWEMLIELESMTNPRLRDQAGKISLVPLEERVSGPGSSNIMAPFTHLNISGSRFSNGTFGVFYAADKLECAVAETKYHREKFLSYTNEPMQDIEMRILIAEFNGVLHNISAMQRKFKEVYALEDYTQSQRLGVKLKQQGSQGIYYSSVRYEDGRCFAIYKPNTISKCRQEKHLLYRWDGKKISHVLVLSTLK